MAMEIERKFLVRGGSWREAIVRSRHICQAYLDSNAALSMRIRIVDKATALLTIKSAEPSMRRRNSSIRFPSTMPNSFWRSGAAH
jgi:CYTH domain-containing protein